MKVISIIMALMVIGLASCDRTPLPNSVDDFANQENSTGLKSENKVINDESKNMLNLEFIDGVYHAKCNLIGYEEFSNGFQPGWYCSEAFDVFVDGSIGDENVFLEIDGGSSYLNSFAVLPENLIKVYIYSVIFEDEMFSYCMGDYKYDEGSNKLTINGLSAGFKGGTVISLGEEEMLVLGPIFPNVIPKENAVLNLYKFKKMSKEDIAEKDSLHVEKSY